MIRESYDVIMNPSVNPLRQLPKIVRFRLMAILAFMWCAIFTIWSGWIALFGPSVFAHILILIGVFFTADIFNRAHKRNLYHLLQ